MVDRLPIEDNGGLELIGVEACDVEHSFLKDEDEAILEAIDI